MENESVFRKCSSCKKDILTGSTYYVCSVTTCRGSATNYGFCSVTCWDAHIPIERHRGDSAGAIEKKAVTEATPAKEGARRIIASQPGTKSAATAEDEILVVVSKVRKYIQDRAGMNTSASVYDLLSEQIKRACDLAIDVARTEGRKTVMDRDFK
jgi:histone H3/H4